MTAGDPHEGTDDHPDHLVEKAVAFKGEGDQFSLLVAVETADGADLVGRLLVVTAPVGAEGGKVMAALEAAGSLAEEEFAEAAVQMPGQSMLQRWQDLAVPEPVSVNFPGGVEAGVKFRRHLLAPHDPDGRRQHGIERAVPLRLAQPGASRRVEMRDLAEGMDAGVGPSRAMNADHAAFGRRSADERHRRLDRVLHRGPAALALPARVWPAVIRQRQLQPHQKKGFGFRVSRFSLSGRSGTARASGRFPAPQHSTLQTSNTNRAAPGGLSNPHPMPRLALFDLDGTLLAHDTQLLFCQFVLRKHGLRRLFLPFAAALAPAGLLGLLEARELKRVFLSYLWLMPRARVEALALEFAETIVPPLLFPEVTAAIERHRREGRVLVLNSASPEFYVREIGRVLGFNRSFGTRVEVADRQPFIAEIDGENNKHGAKLPPMQAAGLLPCAADDSWAYSDSTADLPMLRLVQHPVCINPGARLTAIAAEEQWTVLRPARPWRSRAGQATVVLRQLLGL